MKGNRKSETNSNDENHRKHLQTEKTKLEFNKLAIQAGYSDRVTDEIWKWYDIQNAKSTPRSH
jgi:hypothetical protein